MKNIEKAEQLKKNNDFAIRSCWECNPAHEHLKKASGLFTCYDCGRWYLNGGFFDNEVHCEAEFEEREPLQAYCVTANNTDNQKKGRKNHGYD